MLLKCPKCGADTVAGAIRCGNCARILVRNKQDVKTLRQELAKISANDKPTNPDDDKYLNAWMELRSQQLAYKDSLADRAIDMVLNSFIAAMSLMVTVSVLVYLYVYMFPNESIAIAQNIGLVEKPVVVSDF